MHLYLPFYCGRSWHCRGVYGCVSGLRFRLAKTHCHWYLTTVYSHDACASTIYALRSFLPRDASAERGNATVSRLSVRLSVCLSVTFRYRVQIRWNSSKIISQPNSLGSMCWLTPNIGDLVQREHPQNWGWIGAHKTYQISETVQDRTKVTITD